MKSLGLTAEFYFPVEDNDGKDLRIELGNFELFLTEHYGGYTDTGSVFGYWIDDDTVYQEHHNVISVSSPKLTLKDIEELALIIKRDARQKVVYFKIDGKAFLV